MTGQGSTASRDRPNLVLVHCHDLGQYLGCYGYDVDTPNLDRFAADGVRFENYFCTAPQCSPSRSSMMTGTYPHENGVMGLAHMGWGLDDDQWTLPKRLADAGYSTHLLGFQHEVPEDRPERLGYGTTDTETKRALELVDVVEAFLADREDDDPFFVSLGVEEPHRPFRRDYVDDAAYDDPDPEAVEPLAYLPDRPEIREDVAALQSLTTETLDRAFGRFRESIRDAGIADETLVVFTTDHGLAMPRAKGTCYDSGLETALLVHQPGAVEGGRVREELLSNVDLAPTLLDLLGIDPPDGVAGRSFAPLVRGDAADGDDGGGDATDDERKHVFAEMTWHDRYNPMRAIRTDRYKYVRNFSVLPRVFVPLDVVPTPAGRSVHEEFYVEDCPAEELYDLEADPHEQHNLASDRTCYEPASAGSDPHPDHVDALDDLRSRLESWMESTDDPLLDGPVPYPDVE
ncbi:sulfatase family protein [Halorussus halobius]|uniref:sulfatase family protein n=1 Tax=Halorussus halobius TaxID=1710537 RepID=UPI001091AEB4|nr:sulfatase [Halorussus halobius]